MVAKLTGIVGVLEVGGLAKAGERIAEYNPVAGAAFAFEVDRALRDIGIQVKNAETKNLGKHDGRTEVASLGQFSPPAGALLTANEVRSV